MNCGSIRQSGMNIAPLCRHESINALLFLLMLWKSIVATTDTGINIRNTQ